VSKKKAFISPKSYYARAKVFGVMMALVAVVIILLYFFPNLLK